MAITGPTLVNGTWFDTTNLSTFNTNSGTNTYTVSLVSGRQYFMVIESFSSGAAEFASSVVHDPTGTPLNFTACTDGASTAQVSGWGLTGNEIQVWAVDVTTTTADAAIRITFSAAQSACGAGLFYVTGADLSGNFPQVVNNLGTGTAVSATMASFGATDNMLLLAVARDDIAGGFTPTESRSELYENQETERNWSTTHYQNPNGGDTSVGCTLNVSDDWGAIGIEVKASVAAGPALYDPTMKNPLYNTLLRM